MNARYLFLVASLSFGSHCLGLKKSLEQFTGTLQNLTRALQSPGKNILSRVEIVPEPALTKNGEKIAYFLDLKNKMKDDNTFFAAVGYAKSLINFQKDFSVDEQKKIIDIMEDVDLYAYKNKAEKPEVAKPTSAIINVMGGVSQSYRAEHGKDWQDFATKDNRYWNTFNSDAMNYALSKQAQKLMSKDQTKSKNWDMIRKFYDLTSKIKNSRDLKNALKYAQSLVKNFGNFNEKQKKQIIDSMENVDLYAYKNRDTGNIKFMSDEAAKIIDEMRGVSQAFRVRNANNWESAAKKAGLYWNTYKPSDAISHRSSNSKNASGDKSKNTNQDLSDSKLLDNKQQQDLTPVVPEENVKYADYNNDLFAGQYTKDANEVDYVMFHVKTEDFQSIIPLFFAFAKSFLLDAKEKEIVTNLKEKLAQTKPELTANDASTQERDGKKYLRVGSFSGNVIDTIKDVVAKYHPSKVIRIVDHSIEIEGAKELNISDKKFNFNIENINFLGINSPLGDTVWSKSSGGNAPEAKKNEPAKKTASGTEQLIIYGVAGRVDSNVDGCTLKPIKDHKIVLATIKNVKDSKRIVDELIIKLRRYNKVDSFFSAECECKKTGGVWSGILQKKLLTWGESVASSSSVLSDLIGDLAIETPQEDQLIAAGDCKEKEEVVADLYFNKLYAGDTLIWEDKKQVSGPVRIELVATGEFEYKDDNNKAHKETIKTTLAALELSGVIDYESTKNKIEAYRVAQNLFYTVSGKLTNSSETENKISVLVEFKESERKALAQLIDTLRDALKENTSLKEKMYEPYPFSKIELGELKYSGDGEEFAKKITQINSEEKKTEVSTSFYFSSQLSNPRAVKKEEQRREAMRAGIEEHKKQLQTFRENLSEGFGKSKSATGQTSKKGPEIIKMTQAELEKKELQEGKDKLVYLPNHLYVNINTDLGLIIPLLFEFNAGIINNQGTDMINELKKEFKSLALSLNGLGITIKEKSSLPALGGGQAPMRYSGAKYIGIKSVDGTLIDTLKRAVGKYNPLKIIEITDMETVAVPPQGKTPTPPFELGIRSISLQSDGFGGQVVINKDKS